MFAPLGIRWPLWLGMLLIGAAALVLIEPGADTPDIPVAVEPPSTQTPVKAVALDQRPQSSPFGLDDGTRAGATGAVTEQADDTSVRGIHPNTLGEAEPVNTGVGSSAVEPSHIPNEARLQYEAELQVLRENPQLSPTWRFERSPGNLGEPPKLGTE